MAMRVEARFEIKSWDESPYKEFDDGSKWTRATVAMAFSGDIEGDGATEWLMCSPDGGVTTFVGVQRVAGRIGDRDGRFVLHGSGTFDGKEAKGTWTVVPGSGTGALAGLQGDGSFSAPSGGVASFTLDYDFA
jgi:hypothetical protein